MSGDFEFPEYGIKVSNDATSQRRAMADEHTRTLDEIVRGLANNPGAYPERLVPASRDGTSFVYMHPDPQIQVTFEVAEEEKNVYIINIAAPQFQTAKSIFISYSHEDLEWLELVKKFLYVLEQQGVIEFWDDSKIEPGQEWQVEIEKALDSSKAALLLISQDFLISDFITKYELPRLLGDAEKKGKKIFWIPVSSSTVFESHKEIAKFQSLVADPTISLQDLSDAERKQVLVKVHKQLAEMSA